MLAPTPVFAESVLGSAVREEVASEYGSLLLYTKEGTAGALFQLRSETMIGRAKICDIRIKLPTVSKNHVRITMDENGKVYIENLSKTNPCVLNMKTMSEDTTMLEDGDVFTLGDRSFKYSLPPQSAENTMNHTASYKHKQSLTPIGEAQNEENSGNYSPLVEKKNIIAKVNTPVATMVQVDLKSAAKSPQQSQSRTPVTAPVAEAAQAPSPRAAAQQNSSSKALLKLKTPVREAIHARRKETPTKAKEGIASASASATKKGIKTPIREAINTNRKSYGAPAAAAAVAQTPKAQSPPPSAEAMDVDVEVQEPVVLSTKKSINTPLRKAIESRGMKQTLMFMNSFTKESIMQDVDANEEAAATQRRRQSNIAHVAMNPVFLAAINSRRQSYGNTSSSPKSIRGIQSPKIVRKSMKAAGAGGASPAAPRRLATPLRKVIENRRKSYSCAVSVLEPTSPTATAATTPPPAEVSAKKSKAKSVTSRALVLLRMSPEVSTSAKKATLPSNKKNSKKSKKDAEEEAEDVEMQVDYNASIISATCAQISIDAMSAELQTQGFPEADAFAEAKDVFVVNPSRLSDSAAFSLFDEIISPVRRHVASPMKSPMKSPVPAPAKQGRGRKSLLNSLEKKGMQEERMDAVADLVTSLSDREMGLIHNYALQLESCAIDNEEAYAMALDAYIRGVEQGNLLSPFSPVDRSKKSTEAAAIPPQPPVEEVCEDAFDALRQMFKMTSKAYSADMYAVECYTTLIMDDADVDPAVAYGVALDTFLADPIEFRQRVQHLMSQRQIMLKSPFPTLGAMSEEDEFRRELEDMEEVEEEELWAPVDYNVGPPTPTLTLPAKIKKAAAAAPVNTPLRKSAKKAAAATATPKEKAQDVLAHLPSSSKGVRSQIALSFVTDAIRGVIDDLAQQSNVTTQRAMTPASIKKDQVLNKAANIEFATEAINGVLDSLAEEEGAETLVSPVRGTPAKPQSPAYALIKSALKKPNATPSIAVSATKKLRIASTYVETALAQVIGALAKESHSPKVTSPAPIARSSASKKINSVPIMSAKKAASVKSAVKDIHASSKKRHDIATSFVADAMKLVMCELMEAETLERQSVDTQALVSNVQHKISTNLFSPSVKVKVSPVSAVSRKSPKTPMSEAVPKAYRSPMKSAKAVKKTSRMTDTPVSAAMVASPKVMVVKVATPQVEMAAAVAAASSKVTKVATPIATVAASPTSAVKSIKKSPIQKSPVPFAPVVYAEEEVVKPVNKRTRKTAAAESSPAAKPPAKRGRKAAAAPVIAAAPEVPSRRSKRDSATVVAESNKPIAKRGRKATVVVEVESEEEEEEEGEEEGDEEVAMAILCDGCDNEFFCDAVGLTEVPEGDWFCAGCTKKRAKKTPAAKPAAKSAAKAKAAPKETTAPVRRSTRAR